MLAITLTLNACEEKEVAKNPTEATENAGGGTFTDTRDGKKYKTVKIGEQVGICQAMLNGKP